MSGKTVYLSADQLTALASFLRLYREDLGDQVSFLVEQTELPSDFDTDALVEKINDAELDTVM